MPDRRTLPLPIIARPGRMRSAWHNIRPVPCPFCGQRIGPDHRCPHVVDFLLPGENGGEYGVVVEEISAAGRC